MLRARLFASIAFVLSLALALFVLLYWQEGHWILLVPAAAAFVVIVWPNRITGWLAVAATMALVLLGMLSIGYFYIPSLLSLVVALHFAGRERREATA